MLDIIQCIQSISKGLRFDLTLAFKILAVVDRPLGDRVRITRKKVQPKYFQNVWMGQRTSVPLGTYRQKNY